jgi:hypothetical protein
VAVSCLRRLRCTLIPLSFATVAVECHENPRWFSILTAQMPSNSERSPSKAHRVSEHIVNIVKLFDEVRHPSRLGEQPDLPCLTLAAREVLAKNEPPGSLKREELWTFVLAQNTATPPRTLSSRPHRQPTTTRLNCSARTFAPVTKAIVKCLISFTSAFMEATSRRSYRALRPRYQTLEP